MKTHVFYIVALLIYAVVVVALSRLLYKCSDRSEFCPVGSTEEPNMHCQCWYEGKQCHRCQSPAVAQVDEFATVLFV